MRPDYLGWSIDRAPANGSGIRWIARREFSDGGHKLRADTLAGLKASIREYQA